MNFITSLQAFALSNAARFDLAQNGRDAKAQLLRHAANMSDAAKVQADLAVVSCLEARYSIKAQQMAKQSKYSGWTFENGTAPCKALSRARAMLAPKSSDEAEAAIEKLTAVSSASVDPVAAMLTRFAKLTAGQKRSFKAQMLKV